MRGGGEAVRVEPPTGKAFSLGGQALSLVEEGRLAGSYRSPDGPDSRWLFDEHARRFSELAARLPPADRKAFFEEYVRTAPSPYAHRPPDEGGDHEAHPNAGRFPGALRDRMLERLGEDLRRRIQGDLARR